MWLGLAVASFAVSPGCSCGDGGAYVGWSVAGDGGAGGASGSGGEGGDPHGAGGSGVGGGGQGGTTAQGVTASDVVSAGRVVKSPSYRMVFTLGQPTQNQGKTTSPSYRMQGGLVGANGSLP
ncbi:hypothetical protein WMF31_26105 [Sorangium sp. So ce1036]|uniref:hypothetical protein n=1 Tax=Sorangium sp. So ce1036 TaxID=3133328 RepID=UPI003F07B186